MALRAAPQPRAGEAAPAAVPVVGSEIGAGAAPVAQLGAHFPAVQAALEQVFAQAPQFAESVSRLWQEPSGHRTDEPEQRLAVGGKSVRAHAAKQQRKPRVSGRME